MPACYYFMKQKTSLITLRLLILLKKIFIHFSACYIVFVSSKCILFVYFGLTFLLEAFLKCVVNLGHMFILKMKTIISKCRGRACQLVTSECCYTKDIFGEPFLKRKPPVSCLCIGGRCLIVECVEFAWIPSIVFRLMSHLHTWLYLRNLTWILTDFVFPGI